MPKFTPQQLDELYHQTLAEFAASPEKWTSFLDTAARLYKYDFKSQVLIWSQRPDATACAELPLWNERLHRRVNRGSNGIGIVDNSSGQPRIKYLFDISDTSPRDPSVAPPYIWQMRPDAQDTVLDGISAALGEDMHTEFDFPINLYLSAQCFADKKASEYTDNTDLIRIAVKSTAYSVLQRCGFEPSQYISDIPTGNLSPNELALVGQITQEASETALRSIEQTMKNLDGCKLFRFTTRKRIAEQPSMLYNKGTERVSEATKEGAVIDGRTDEESVLSRGAGRQDAPRSGRAGVRRMGSSASEVHEAVPAGGTDGIASELRAEPLSEQAGSPRDGQIRVAGSTESEASWRDRGTERTRPDAVDRSDGQHSARSDADHRGNLHLLNSQTAAEPEKPAAVAFEQMSLMDDSSNVFQSNTQTAAPTSDVFDWNTPDVSDEVINRVLTAGSNSTHSRERIAAFFMQPNVSMADAAAFLRREYRIGGAGVRVHNIDHSLWFDGNGLRIARGHDTRTPRAAVLTYEDAANRISTLLKNGQYASAAELTDAKPNEYRELASEIWHAYHDMSEEAREQGFFAQTKEFANDVFPPAVEKLTAALSDPARRAVLTGEMTDYARAVQRNSDLCRFRFNVQRSEDAAERLQRTERMTALYAAADGFEPARAAFITQDEIDEMLRSGSGIERGKKRISEFYAENHTQKERIEFLKNEYGWGGRAYGGYSENHDGKGIAFERSIDRKVYDRITLSWSQVDHQISTLIRQNRYLTPEEQRRYAQERTDTVTISEPENVFQSNTQNEPPAAEPDDFSDIDPIAIREALAERGIVNGKVVDPEKLNRDPFIQRVMADVGQTPQADVLQSNTQKQQAPVDTLNDYNSIKLNASYADSIVLFQVGDFFEMFGEDAKQAAALLELNLTTRELPGTGRVEMCGIPAHSLERYVEKLRDKHDVTIAATKDNSTERHVYTMRSIDHEAEDAINAYETEFGADGLRAFHDASAETQANVFQSNTRSAEPTQPKQFIAHFYVAEDIQKRGALDIKEFHSLEDALNAYHKLPNNQRKALGAMNTEALPGSLDFVQCVDGKDTIIQDYTKVAGWQNAEVLNSIAQIERSLNTREAVSVPAENVFQSNTPETPDTDRFEIYQLTADPANAKLLFTSYDGVHADGRTFTERQDIGDGDGGLLDFLSQYPAYNDIMPMLREAAGSTPESENVFQSNTQDTSAPENDDVFQSNTPAYQVGDTVYLDGRPFEITEIGKLNIQLRDPAQPYPIFRSESRESLARLMTQDERNAAPDVFQSNTQTDGAQPASIMIDGKWTEFPSVQEAEKASLEEYRNALRRNPPTFHITDDNLGNGTLSEKFDRNIAAIRLLNQLETENRPATAEEQQVLSRYVGWGGMANAFSPDNRRYDELKNLLTADEYKAARASVLNAHYTSPTIIRAIYDAAAQFGFENGKILEPSMGVGNFFGMLPESMKDSQLTGVELDSISGRIARKLYPNADIKITGYENTKFADNSFDFAVGNVPFGDYSLHDKRYDKEHLLIHDYFLVKSLDKVRPGGVVAFVTSKGTLDKANPAARRLMAEKADLLGAIRLPNTAFKANAGASVTTDILFLQKRDTPPEQLPAWTETGKNADGMELNNYFLQHPEMILGTMQEVTTQYGKDTVCVPDPNVELEDLLSAAVLHLGHENVFQSNTLIEDDVFQSNTQEPPAPETADVFQSNTPMEELHPFSYAVQDGKLMFKEADGNLVPSEMNATAVKRAISMIGIRDAVRNLIEAQRDGCDDEQLHALQADLTQNYDTFVKEFGNIHKRGNKLAFRKDAGYPLLLALEKLDDEQNVIGKTAIFSKRTISPHIVATHADTPEDALGLSLAERGKIDLAYMSALLDGMPQEQITTALRQQIFLDPQTQEWQPADEYLSGNVRAKLDIARLAAQSDPDFAVNVQMLERVQPEPLTAADINVKLGTTWIPPEDINRFIRDVLHPPFYTLDKIKTSYSDAAKLWYVSNKSVDNDPHSLAYTKYGTSRVNAYELLELSLNLRDVQVSDVKIIDGKEKRIPNTKETIKARNAQDALRQAFKDWVFDDPARRERLVGYYNEHFNTTRPREFDGSHLTLPGINPSIQLYSHQKDAVARILYGGNALLAHCVGAGKTWTMAAAAMELRRLGLSHKPMFVVPNSLTEQWGTEFQQLYPGANILVATEADFTKENRKAFCARIATGDYDAVIIGHTQFEKIPLSPENERRHIERQLDALELSLTDAKRNKDLNFTVKRLESSKKKLETRLEKLMDAKEKDDVVTFEELGVDRLFVDEADEFKNLALFTKMRNVGGISTSAAQKSEDMLAKCEYLNEKTDYHGVCFATGTPVSNSMTELYTMMRYLQNDTLESVNMTDFDSWASNFGETVTAMELAPEGTGYRTKTRFAKFCNLPELINLWRQAADIQTADMLDLQRPEVEYHNVKAQPTAAQQAMVQELGKRADRVRSGAVAPYEDNMLAITNDGRKLALDQRLADSSLPDDPGSKLNMVVENVFNTWESSKPTKGTQLIFCDLATPSAAGKDSGRFCSYDDIRDKLIAKGVPADQIAYIHDADTPAKKNALSSKMKSGAIRVLIGSTAKMGAGFNVQERLVALHHVDCPWRPRDVEQRDGRILRQGNTNEKVHIYRYVTEGTFDSYNWQTVENKQKFISQVVTGKSPARTCDDIDDAALSYAEVKALAAGDPEIKERMELDVDVQKLSVLRTAYHNDQYKLEDDVNVNLPHSIVKKENMIAALKRDQATLDANHAQAEGDTFCIELNGKTYNAKDKAGEALLSMVAAERKKISQNMDGKLTYEDARPIGSYCGFALELKRSLMDEVRICIHGDTKRMVELGDSATGCIQRINNAMNDIGKFITDNEQSLVRLHEQLDEAKANLGKPWPLEDEYQQKISRLNELNYKLTRHHTSENSPEHSPAQSELEL